MAGHSKWKNIRLHKGKADVERAKIFGKLGRELTIAAKLGGGNPDSNPRLRLAIEKARGSSMPADNIKRAVQKGTGELSSETYEEITYEGYGPGGVAVLVEAATDNRNRTVADLRHAFSRFGGSLGESGSVAWQFTRQGVVTIAAEGLDEDAVMEAALEAGAEDLQRNGDSFAITTPVDDLSTVRDALAALNFTIEEAEIEMVPQTMVQLEGEQARKALKLVDALEDLDDVQTVSANFDVTDDILQEQ